MPNTNNGVLRPGQIVKYDAALWRVEHVNDSRARIVPLAKRQVSLGDRIFEADRAGANISPRSCVEIIDNVEQALDEMQLGRAEEELKEAKREAEREAQAAGELAAAEAELAALQGETAAVGPIVAEAPTPAVPAGAGGWRVNPAEKPTFKPGTMGQQIYDFITRHPGLTTKQIVETTGVKGAVAACVSRFHQAGLIIR